MYIKVVEHNEAYLFAKDHVKFIEYVFTKIKNKSFNYKTCMEYIWEKFWN